MMMARSFLSGKVLLESATVKALTPLYPGSLNFCLSFGKELENKYNHFWQLMEKGKVKASDS